MQQLQVLHAAVARYSVCDSIYACLVHWDSESVLGGNRLSRCCAWCLPTVQVPPAVASRLHAYFRRGCNANCRPRVRLQVDLCLWHKRSPVAAICIVNLFGALVKRCRWRWGASGKWQPGEWSVASCKWPAISGKCRLAGDSNGSRNRSHKKRSSPRRISILFSFGTAAWAELASHLATWAEGKTHRHNGNWCCGIAGTSWACNLAKHVQILSKQRGCHSVVSQAVAGLQCRDRLLLICCCGIFVGSCNCNNSRGAMTMLMPCGTACCFRQAARHHKTPWAAVYRGSTLQVPGVQHQRRFACCLLHVARYMLMLLLHLRAVADSASCTELG